MEKVRRFCRNILRTRTFSCRLPTANFYGKYWNSRKLLDVSEVWRWKVFGVSKDLRLKIRREKVWLQVKVRRWTKFFQVFKFQSFQKFLEKCSSRKVWLQVNFWRWIKFRVSKYFKSFWGKVWLRVKVWRWTNFQVFQVFQVFQSFWRNVRTWKKFRRRVKFKKFRWEIFCKSSEVRRQKSFSRIVSNFGGWIIFLRNFNFNFNFNSPVKVFSWKLSTTNKVLRVRNYLFREKISAETLSTTSEVLWGRNIYWNKLFNLSNWGKLPAENCFWRTQYSKSQTWTCKHKRKWTWI